MHNTFPYLACLPYTEVKYSTSSASMVNRERAWFCNGRKLGWWESKTTSTELSILWMPFLQVFCYETAI